MAPPLDFDAEAVLAEANRKRDEHRAAAAKELKDARALYSDTSGDPVLRASFAVYMDGLGTKASMPDLTDENLKRQVALLDRFRWFLHDDEWEEHSQRFLSFSDDVILGVPIDSATPGGYGLGMLLGSIDAYQVNMAIHGQFLRGGIAAGALYMDDRFVTGLALVDAVVIEEEVAVYPRVVLGPTCVEIVLDDLAADYPEPFQFDAPWNSQLLVDADGSVFLNYLPVIDGAPDAIRIEVVEAGLQAHRSAVTEKLERFTNAGRVREKYVWAAHYHNYVCREFFSLLPGDFTIRDPLTALEQKFERSFRRLVRWAG